MSDTHKLRELRLKKVDFVDQGANQYAHIKLAKRQDDAEAPTDAAAATDERAFFERLGAFVAKMFRSGTAAEAQPVVKEAQTFEQVENGQDIRNRVYRISDSMASSIYAIIDDKTIDDAKRAELIAQTAEQVAAAIKGDIASAFGGTVQKSAESEQEAEPTEQAETTDGPITKGDDTEMKLDISKMTPEDKSAYDELAKRYALDEDGQQGTQEEPEDLYKSLNPTVKAELENLRKFRQEAEDREIMDVAKRYALLGKKPEELAPVLKQLKSAGGSAYDDMIGVLDSSLTAVEQAGAFSEIGKRGSDTPTGDGAWGKIEAAAQEIAKSRPGIKYADAIDAACMAHPDLVEEYEKARR